MSTTAPKELFQKRVNLLCQIDPDKLNFYSAKEKLTKSPLGAPASNPSIYNLVKKAKLAMMPQPKKNYPSKKDPDKKLTGTEYHEERMAILRKLSLHDLTPPTARIALEEAGHKHVHGKTLMALISKVRLEKTSQPEIYIPPISDRLVCIRTTIKECGGWKPFMEIVNYIQDWGQLVS